MSISKFGESLTQERLKELLTYDPETGIFTWNFNRRGLLAGSVAGHLNNSNGYITISVDKRSYRAHRLAWLYTYGDCPLDCIDHINHDRKDNRLCNLRDVPKADNQFNLSKSKRNKSGHTGVSFYKAYNKWAAEIIVRKKKIFLGYFENIEEAVAARLKAEEEQGFSPTHGK